MSIILGIIGLIFLVWLFFTILEFVLDNLDTVIFVVIIIIVILCITRCVGCSSKSSAQKNDEKALKAMVKENNKRAEDKRTVLSFQEIVNLNSNGEYKSALNEMEKYKRVKDISGESLSYAELYYVASILYNNDKDYHQAKVLLDECIKNINSIDDKTVKENLTQYINNSCKNELCGQWIAVEEKSKSYPSKITFYSDGTGLIGYDLIFEWKTSLTEPNKYKVSISTKSTRYNLSVDTENHSMNIWQTDFVYSLIFPNFLLFYLSKNLYIHVPFPIHQI